MSIEDKIIKFNRCDYKIKVSEERVAECFNKDIQSVINDCNAVFSDFESFGEEVKQIIANMMFNMGRTKIKNLFPSMCKAIRDKNYKRAVLEMTYNYGLHPERGYCAWYIEVGLRSKRLVKRMDDYANEYLCNSNKSTI